MPANTSRRLVGLTDLAWQIAAEQSASQNYDSISDWIEYLILCQQFAPSQAESLWRLRSRRGGMGGVRVVPDCVELPEEG